MSACVRIENHADMNDRRVSKVSLLELRPDACMLTVGKMKDSKRIELRFFKISPDAWMLTGSTCKALFPAPGWERSGR